MSIDHHVRASRERDRRRFFVDIVLVAILLIAIIGVFFMHRMRESGREELRRQAEVGREADRDAVELERARRDAAERQSATERVSTTDATQGAPLLATADSTGGGDESVASSPSSKASSLQNETPLTHVRFEDVTVTRYDSARLGFVMELPVGWSPAYEGGESIAFANFVYDFGISDADMLKKADAMWIRVQRPCIPTEATSTIFQFASSSDVYIREARSCIPPFEITVGYRTDAPDWSGRERFLLSVARTFYPMVKSQFPYESIR